MIDMQAGRQTDRRTDCQTGRQADRQTHTDRLGSQADRKSRQTDRRGLALTNSIGPNTIPVLIHDIFTSRLHSTTTELDETQLL